jgi:hypothetical protein
VSRFHPTRPALFLNLVYLLPPSLPSSVHYCPLLLTTDHYCVLLTCTVFYVDTYCSLISVHCCSPPTKIAYLCAILHATDHSFLLLSTVGRFSTLNTHCSIYSQMCLSSNSQPSYHRHYCIQIVCSNAHQLLEVQS